MTYTILIFLKTLTCIENLMRHKYRKRDDQYVIAVQINLDSKGFEYRKWGAIQKCRPGDWLVNNAGETYTIDQNVFEKTYEKIEDGKYIKITPVWAEIAKEDGCIQTIEGKSFYKAGDYLVFNDNAGVDAYCIDAEQFNKMYQAD